jgi:hypothetical protein
MSTTPLRVTLLTDAPTPDRPEPPPRQHSYRDPGYAIKDELSAAAHNATNENGPMLRVLAATVGLCTRLGTESKLDYVKAGCNPLRYGGAFLEWFRSQPGADTSALIEAGAAILRAIREDLFPREAEVTEALGKSEGSEGGRTGSPSTSPSPTATAISAGSLD